MRSLACIVLLGFVLGCDRDHESPPPEPSSTLRSSPSTPPANDASRGPMEPVGRNEKRAGTPEAAPSEVRAAVAPTPGTVRLVLVSESEPFTSEKSQWNALARHVEKAGVKVDESASTPEEKTYLKEFAATPEAPPPLPASWATFETVVVLRLEAPRVVGSQKTSGGRSHLVILHPPTLTPAFSNVYVERSPNFSTGIDGARLGLWIKNHLEWREGSK